MSTWFKRVLVFGGRFCGGVCGGWSGGCGGAGTLELVVVVIVRDFGLRWC